MIKIDDYELKPEESKVVSDSLELYARFFQGQFSHLAHVFNIAMTGKLGEPLLRKVVWLLERAQVIVLGNVMASWRIGSNFVPRSALIAHRLGLMIDGEVEEAKKMVQLMGLNSDKHDRPGGPPPGVA